MGWLSPCWKAEKRRLPGSGCHPPKGQQGGVPSLPLAQVGPEEEPPSERQSWLNSSLDTLKGPPSTGQPVLA